MPESDPMTVAQVSETARSTRRRVLVGGTGGPACHRLVEVLARAGFEVSLAGTEEQAREHIVDRPPDIVVWYDLTGEPSGLLDRIRSLDSEHRPYALVVGGPDAACLERAMRHGADDYVIGPVDAAYLEARLRVAEEHAGMNRRLSETNGRLRDTVRELERANRKMRQDLQAAARIQQALLPHAKAAAPGIEVGWRLRPCDELAGDILNWFRLDERFVGFYILDVSGHGVPAALMSVQVARMMSPLMSDSELLKQRLPEPPWYRVVEPAGVLARLNECFELQPDFPCYFTMIYGLIDDESGRLTFAAAGHPPPIHVPAGGQPVAIPGSGLPVGLIEGATYEQREIRLAPGDRLWVYSDGISEAVDARGEALGPAGLEAWIRECVGDPIEDAVEAILRRTETRNGSVPPSDDCSLLVIEKC